MKRSIFCARPGAALKRTGFLGLASASALFALCAAVNVDCGGDSQARGSGSGSGSGGGVSGSSSGPAGSSSGGGPNGSSSGSAGSSSGGNPGGSSSGSPSGSSSGASVHDGGAEGGTPDGGSPCSPNSLNYDIPGNGCDDDGDGIVDNRITCDQGAPPPALGAAGPAADFAAAIELCQLADATHWGVVSAVYTNGHSQTGAGPNNFAQQHGVLPSFGSVVVPREGASLGALSSGSATVQDSDFQADGTNATGAFKGCKNGMQNDAGASTGCTGAVANSGDLPNGFPKTAPNCPTGTIVDDVIDVKLTIKVPANASGISFDFDFHASDWPDYVCTGFNDSFVAYLQSSAFNNGAADNVAFDTTGTPISVNSPLFGVCTPNTPTGCTESGLLGLGGSDGGTGTSVCALGPAQLAGTGYYDLGTYCTSQSTGGGATGWLTSRAPVSPGETISLEFIIFDLGDWNYDSSVLLDNLFWEPGLVLAPVTVPSAPN